MLIEMNHERFMNKIYKSDHKPKKFDVGKPIVTDQSNNHDQCEFKLAEAKIAS